MIKLTEEKGHTTIGDQLIQCIKDGHGKALFELFNPNDWEVKTIDQYQDISRREIWTDSSVVMLYPEDMEQWVTSGSI